MDWIAVVNQNIQKLIAQSTIRDREVGLRSHPDFGVEIIVDGKVYQELDEIDDLAIRELIQVAINEWQDKEAAPTEPIQTLRTWRGTPFNLSRKWTTGWLILLILIFVIPMTFVTPTYMAVRFSFACTGSIIGAIVGIWGGRQIGKQVTPKMNNPGCLMSGQILGVFTGLILGWIITASILALLFPS